VREYETAFIVQPEISDEGSLDIRGKLDGVLEAQGVTRLMCEDLGKRKLAYEIRKFHKGHYFIISYLDGGGVVPELERVLRLEESVLRFMTVQVSDRIADVEARVAEAREAELAQVKRAEERAARDIEEARIRASAEEEAIAARQKVTAEVAEEKSEPAAAEEKSEPATAEVAEEKSEPATAATAEGEAESAETQASEETEEAAQREPSS
jgi:small subunit ribosomal protein S6